MPTGLHTHDHSHSEVHDLGWEGFGRRARELAELVRADFAPGAVVGIAKGGVLPAVVLSSAFGLDFYPIRLSTRVNERVVRQTPELLVPPTGHLAGRRVLLVDDICISGRTLELAGEAIRRVGAIEVRTAVLAVHKGSRRPDWWALETDALILMPWDRDVLSSDGWVLNPEYREQWPQPDRRD
jgi:hypoxanthine phosphoribosyltransferase